MTTIQNRIVKAVVLDMDGLMIDTEPLYMRAFQKAAKEFGYELTDYFLMGFVGRPDNDCRNIIAEQFGTGFPLDTFWERWPQVWREEALTNGIDRKPGLPELLSYLSEVGLPSAIATSAYRDQAEFSLNRASVTTYPFTHIVTGDEVSRGKPAPDIFLEAARRLGIKPRQCVALEDSENGIKAATSAGMISIMVPDLIQPSEEIRKSAWRVVDSLHEVRELLSGLQIASGSR